MKKIAAKCYSYKIEWNCEHGIDHVKQFHFLCLFVRILRVNEVSCSAVSVLLLQKLPRCFCTVACKQNFFALYYRFQMHGFAP